MKDTETQQRFIELRAEGKSYNEISEALHISKTTCSKWNKKLDKAVADRRQERLQELYKQYGMVKEARIRRIADRLKQIDAALDEVDLTTAPPEKLLELYLKYYATLKDEYTGPRRPYTFMETGSPADIIQATGDLLDRVRNGDISREQSEHEAAIIAQLFKTYIDFFDRAPLAHSKKAAEDWTPEGTFDEPEEPEESFYDEEEQEQTDSDDTDEKPAALALPQGFQARTIAVLKAIEVLKDIANGQTTATKQDQQEARETLRRYGIDTTDAPEEEEEPAAREQWTPAEAREAAEEADRIFQPDPPATEQQGAAPAPVLYSWTESDQTAENNKAAERELAQSEAERYAQAEGRTADAAEQTNTPQNITKALKEAQAEREQGSRTADAPRPKPQRESLCQWVQR